MGLTLGETAKLWAESGGEPLVRERGTQSMTTDGMVLYSYGTPIAIHLKEGGVLHNGDRHSKTTTRHQAEARRAYRGPQVPFLAFREFGVPVAEVEVVEEAADYQWWWCQKCNEEAPGSACSRCGGKAHYRHRLGATVTRHQDRYFLGAFDEQERPGRCYFVTELPRPVTTYQEALDVLIPDEVRGRSYRRQGDIFAVPQEGMRVPKEWVKHGVRLFGTNHVGTTVAVNPDAPDRVFVRGAIYHRPLWREADHAPMYGVRPWHEVFVNTAREMGFPTFGLGGRVD